MSCSYFFSSASSMQTSSSPVPQLTSNSQHGPAITQTIVLGPSSLASHTVLCNRWWTSLMVARGSKETAADPSLQKQI